MAVLPGILGCSFDRLRTSSPCDVLKNTPQVRAPASCPAAQPSPRSRYGVSCTMRASLLRIVTRKFSSDQRARKLRFSLEQRHRIGLHSGTRCGSLPNLLTLRQGTPARGQANTTGGRQLKADAAIIAVRLTRPRSPRMSICHGCPQPHQCQAAFPGGPSALSVSFVIYVESTIRNL